MKKFWKRVNALIYDNRTVLCEGEYIEDWEEVQRKQRVKEAERQRKEQEILANWFLREEYINAGWFKRLLLRIEQYEKQLKDLKSNFYFVAYNGFILLLHLSDSISLSNPEEQLQKILVDTQDDKCIIVFTSM